MLRSRGYVTQRCSRPKNMWRDEILSVKAASCKRKTEEVMKALLISFRSQIFAAIFLCAFATSASAFDPSEPIKEIISELEKAVLAMISAAEGSSSRVLWRAAQQARATVDALKAGYDDSLDKTFSELNKAEEKVFLDLQETLSMGDDMVADRLEQIGDIQRRLSAVFSDRPIVFRYSPSYISNSSGEVTLRFIGVNFDRISEAATANLLDSKFPIQVLSAEEFAVVVPRGRLSNSDAGSLRIIQGHIDLPVKKNRLLHLLSTEKVERYQVLLFSLPNRLATVYLDGTIRTTQDIERDRSSQEGCHYNQGRSEHHTTSEPFSATPTDGWEIIIGSERLERTVARPTGGGIHGRCWIDYTNQPPTSRRIVFYCHPVPENRHHGITMCAVVHYKEMTRKATEETIEMRELGDVSLDTPRRSFTLPSVGTSEDKSVVADVKVIVQEFDGKRHEFRESGSTEWLTIGVREARRTLEVQLTPSLNQ